MDIWVAPILCCVKWRTGSKKKKMVILRLKKWILDLKKKKFGQKKNKILGKNFEKNTLKKKKFLKKH